MNFDGDAVDAMIDLTVNTVRSFHRTKVIAPRDVGPSEMAVDVPEATETHLDQTVKNWPLGQTLVISAGIHPGILDKKGGWFNLQIPGTFPTGTEVLVVLDVETVSRSEIVVARRRSAARSENRGPFPIRAVSPARMRKTHPVVECRVAAPVKSWSCAH